MDKNFNVKEKEFNYEEFLKEFEKENDFFEDLKDEEFNYEEFLKELEKENNFFYEDLKDEVEKGDHSWFNEDFR